MQQLQRSALQGLLLLHLLLPQRLISTPLLLQLLQLLLSQLLLSTPLLLHLLQLLALLGLLTLAHTLLSTSLLLLLLLLEEAWQPYTVLLWQLLWHEACTPTSTNA